VRLRHGGELRSFAEKFGISESDVLDFSSNINPLGPPASIRKVYESSLEDLTHYPDPEALEFRRAVSRHFPLWPENVVAGNGAIELLDLILRLLRPKRALLIEPAFLEYRRLLNLWGCEIRSVMLKEKDSFRGSLPEMTNALQGAEVAFLAQPNNPTGTFFTREEMVKFLSEARRRNVFVVIDEAFVDWMPELTLGREVKDDAHFFVVRSLTKFYALPGIRIGYGLGARKLIEKLSTQQIPWSCNRLAQKLGVVALQDSEFASRSRQWNLEERDWFEGELRSFSGLKVYSSAANFVLIRSASGLFEEMAKQGIYIRDLTEFPGLGPSFYRIAVRKREDNVRFLEALRHLREKETAFRS